MLLDGKINGRMEGVAIFGSEWLKNNRGNSSRAAFVLITFLDNVLAHLRPSYLFFSGDPMADTHPTWWVNFLSSIRWRFSSCWQCSRGQLGRWRDR